MGNVAYLKPAMSRAATKRLLADVEAAVAEGRDLVDRREVLRDVVAALHRDQARLLDVIEGLRAGPPSGDPLLAAQLVRLDETCCTLHADLVLMIRKADRLIAP